MAQDTPTTYEQLGRRVQQQLEAATHRQQYQITLSPQPGDEPADWERLLEESETHGNVDLTRLDNGEVLITWNPAEAV